MTDLTPVARSTNTTDSAKFPFTVNPDSSTAATALTRAPAHDRLSQCSRVQPTIRYMRYWQLPTKLCRACTIRLIPAPVVATPW